MTTKKLKVAVLSGLIAVACAAPGTPAARAEGDVVAKVGERKITLDELDNRAKAANMQAYQQLYEARRSTLEQMISEVLMADEAKRRGVTTDALVAEEISGRAQKVSAAEIEQFYNQNQARMQGQTLEAMSARIGQFLEQQGQEAARVAFIDELKKKANVSISLDAPRVEVAIAKTDPVKGPDNAPITVVEFSEFQCPYCSRVAPTVKQVMDTYGDKIRLVFRDYPLPFHNNAHTAAEAGQCAHDQGKFWDFHDKLFANQSALDADSLKKYAAELGLDAKAFNECLDSGRHKARVDEDYAQGQAVGVQGTPAFFINGRFLNGAQPFDTFKQVIDEELARLN